jgi:hypothetical protein
VAFENQGPVRRENAAVGGKRPSLPTLLPLCMGPCEHAHNINKMTGMGYDNRGFQGSKLALGHTALPSLLEAAPLEHLQG